MEREDIKCEYIQDDGQCRAIQENKEGQLTRDQSCSNQSKYSCCYLCNQQDTCEISCGYLDTDQVVKNRDKIATKITRHRKAIGRFSLLFAEGKITEESYITSVNRLERKIDALRRKNSQTPSIGSNTVEFNEIDEDLVESPSILWYLVPFFFGLIGGLIGYVAVKDQDRDMANGLLIFGIFISFITTIIVFMSYSWIFSTIWYF